MLANHDHAGARVDFPNREKALLSNLCTLRVTSIDNFSIRRWLVTRYVHGPTGIHMQQNPNGTWRSMMQDGLGSVRGVYSGGVISTQEYSPYGVPLDTMAETDFGFTGEVTDNNGLVYLRARYLNPGMGVFSGRDPFEGFEEIPASWNHYSWVEGNPVNFVDADGYAAMMLGKGDCPSLSLSGV